MTLIRLRKVFLTLVIESTGAFIVILILAAWPNRTAPEISRPTLPAIKRALTPSFFNARPSGNEFPARTTWQAAPSDDLSMPSLSEPNKSNTMAFSFTSRMPALHCLVEIP